MALLLHPIRTQIPSPPAGGAGFDPAKKIKSTITRELSRTCNVKHTGETKISIRQVEYLVDHVETPEGQHG